MIGWLVKWFEKKKRQYTNAHYLKCVHCGYQIYLRTASFELWPQESIRQWDKRFTVLLCTFCHSTLCTSCIETHACQGLIEDKKEQKIIREQYLKGLDTNTPTKIPDLISLLERRIGIGAYDYEAGERALKSLVQIGKPAVQPIIAALGRKREPMKEPFWEKLLWALGQIRDPIAIDPILSMMKDKNCEWADQEESVKTAVQTVAQIGGVDRLTEAMKDKTNTLRVRQEIAALLGKTGDSKAIGPLISTLEELGSASFDALVMFGDAALNSLSAAMRSEHISIQREACKILGKIGASALEPLILALKHEDSIVREEAVNALWKIRNPKSVEPLIAAMKDYGASVRFQAAKALKSFGWIPSNQEERIIYLTALRNCRELGAMGTPAVKALVSLLRLEGEILYWDDGHPKRILIEMGATGPYKVYYTDHYSVLHARPSSSEWEGPLPESLKECLFCKKQVGGNIEGEFAWVMALGFACTHCRTLFVES
jgi:HEAT repeat protein